MKNHPFDAFGQLALVHMRLDNEEAKRGFSIAVKVMAEEIKTTGPQKTLSAVCFSNATLWNFEYPATPVLMAVGKELDSIKDRYEKVLESFVNGPDLPKYDPNKPQERCFATFIMFSWTLSPKESEGYSTAFRTVNECGLAAEVAALAIVLYANSIGNMALPKLHKFEPAMAAELQAMFKRSAEYLGSLP